MKLSNSLFVLVLLGLWVCCTPVNAQADYWANQLKSRVIALDSADIAGESNVRIVGKDLDREFQVLGIGEQSHGTSEFFQARLLLIKALIDDPAVTKIGLEAPMAEVEKLNEYLSEGRGDLKEILRSFRSYGYECREFADFVGHIGRLGKQRGKGIRFFGFDMQSPFQSLQNLRDSGVTGDISDSLQQLLSHYNLLSNEVYNHNFSPADFAELKALSDQVLEKIAPRTGTNTLAGKSMTNYRQFLLLNDPVHGWATNVLSEIRDSLMAENVLAEIEPGKKMVILAHNAHLQRTPNVFSNSLGTFLSRKLKTAYQCVALTTSYGFYTALNAVAGRVTDTNKVMPGDSSCFEYHFSQIGQPVFFSKTAALKTHTSGVALPRRYRVLVYGATDDQFFDGNLFRDFDYVLHVRRTTGARSFYLE